jgi:putative mycofactocin binding protein MftB
VTATPDAASEAVLDARLGLSPSVALRPEPFGALAYHFGNRRLTFLKRPELVALVRNLNGSRTTREALADSAIPADQWTAYAEALQALVVAEMLTPSTGRP